MKLTLHEAIGLAIDSGIKTQRMLGRSDSSQPMTMILYAMIPQDVWNQIIDAYYREIQTGEE